MTDPVTHAKSYPFPVPGRSYVFRNGVPHDMDDHGFERVGRTPVLAAGSNQSHEQLARKYSVLPGHVEIPVQRGVLHDFDSVMPRIWRVTAQCLRRFIRRPARG